MTFDITDIIERRNTARKAKQWAIADALRNEALLMGYELVDKATETIAIPHESERIKTTGKLSPDNFFVSYRDENGRSWSMCVAPYERMPGFDERLKLAISQQPDAVREELEKFCWRGDRA